MTVLSMFSPDQPPKLDTSQEEAAQVLAYYGQLGGYPAGDWTRALISLIDSADARNYAALREAFPGYGDAVHAFKYDPDGVAKLQVIATAPVKKPETT